MFIAPDRRGSSAASALLVPTNPLSTVSHLLLCFCSFLAVNHIFKRVFSVHADMYFVHTVCARRRNLQMVTLVRYGLFRAVFLQVYASLLS